MRCPGRVVTAWDAVCAECLALMSRATVGRIVFSVGGLPAVHPVPFVLDAATIDFPATDDRVRVAAERGDIVAFQVDQIDQVSHLRDGGWTVTAIGRCSLVGGPAGDRDQDRGRIAIELVDGRRLSPAPGIAGVRRRVPS
jgi:nitroimidazol reductase NimA-like FMN-containing flavoprotein (pyridoxamine 5'-phosphate oxidase superfamily)